MISQPFLNPLVLEEEEECSDDADYGSDVAEFSRTVVDDTDTELDETDSNDTVPHFSKLDITDDMENIKLIVEAGQIEKLKVDQCKMYLRKNGLRLSGNKDALVKRIKEHLEILNAGGEKIYPVSSFILNCTGDACTGDVVMFEQNVYEMFSIVSRSATGPPCGTRTIVGRIVKESYGAAKQQHTFTIEVLWSKGTKPLPPLYPLLIKGRNLYKMKTFRQRWENEGDRQRVLLEKHSRGSLARSARETRVLEKEKWKMQKINRVSRKEGSNATSTTQAQQTTFISLTKSTNLQNRVDSINKNGRGPFQPVPSQRNIRPLTGIKLQSTGQPILQGHMQRQCCRHYARRRCYYGENCKFSHDIGKKCIPVMENLELEIHRSLLMQEYHYQYEAARLAARMKSNQSVHLL